MMIASLSPQIPFGLRPLLLQHRRLGEVRLCAFGASAREVPALSALATVWIGMPLDANWKGSAGGRDGPLAGKGDVALRLATGNTPPLGCKGDVALRFATAGAPLLAASTCEPTAGAGPESLALAEAGRARARSGLGCAGTTGRTGRAALALCGLEGVRGLKRTEAASSDVVAICDVEPSKQVSVRRLQVAGQGSQGSGARVERESLRLRRPSRSPSAWNFCQSSLLGKK